MFHRCAEITSRAARFHYTKWQRRISLLILDAAGAAGFLSTKISEISFLRLTFLDLLRYTNY